MDISQRRSVRLTVDGKPLEGTLTVPRQPSDLVLFATGTAGAHLASLETKMVDHLHQLGLATLVVDLISPEEATERSNRLNIELLTSRLAIQFDWAANHVATADLGTILCGVGTGAAAAVNYLTSARREVGALTLLNGRVDLASVDFAGIDIPSFFFVDNSSAHLTECNREAYRALGVDHEHKHYLHAVSEDAVSVVARWLNSQVSSGTSHARALSRRDSRHGV
ncbi:hypothetical protein [Salinibaculum salinum]|uniref:hypothetical protein n=1 Tax=Salinibaculum salinum TaxID=3131996 RepID=UPI0030EF8535